MKTSALLVLLLSVVGAVEGLYFNVLKEGHRCFLVDVPAQTTFRAEYESPDATDVMKTMVAFYAPDPSKGDDENTLVKKEATSQKGSMSFTAQQNGVHWVCVSLDSSNYALPDDASMRFALKLMMGTSHEEYRNLAKKNQMDDLHLEIMKLRDRVSAIQRNQDYVKVVTLMLCFRSTNKESEVFILVSSCVRTGKKLDTAVIDRTKQLSRYVGFGSSDCDITRYGFLPSQTPPGLLPQEEVGVV